MGSFDRSSKVVGLEQITDFVRPGDTVALGGSWLSNQPMAAVRQLARAGVRGLHVEQVLGSIGIDLLAGVGALEEVTHSMVSFEAYGLAMNFRRGVEAGTLTAREVTGLAFIMATDAAAKHMPFQVFAGAGDSDLIERNPDYYGTVVNPFTGEEQLVVRANHPDVAIVHALRADASGNTQYDGPVYTDPELARAAGRVIVTCEEIVSTEEIAQRPELTKIPGFLVDAVIEVPFGAHPTTHVPAYGLDAWKIFEYQEAAADVESWAAYSKALLAETEEEYRERFLGRGRAEVLRSIPQRNQVNR
jgi:glutaconate CoA-transferase subunit A